MSPEQRPAAELIIQDQADIRTAQKMALENAGFRVVEVDSRNDAPALLHDARLGIDLLITSSDFAGLQLAVEADRQGLPIIITAEAAWPIGIHNTIATLLEPVSNTELISTAARSCSVRETRLRAALVQRGALRYHDY